MASNAEDKAFALRRKKYKWEAAKRSGIFREELSKVYQDFRISGNWPDTLKVKKLFIKSTELKELAENFNIDSHAPFEDLLDDNLSNVWNIVKLDASVKIIRQISEFFPVKLAIKDNKMIVSIDIRRPKEQILYEIESILNIHQGNVGKLAKRGPIYDLEDYVIFDMWQHGLTPWEIAQFFYKSEIDGKTYVSHSGKNYSKEARNAKKKIDEAINRAKASIISIKPAKHV